MHNGHKDLFSQVSGLGGLEKLLVGIGVNNRFGVASNVFLPEEVKEMLEPVVKETSLPYNIRYVPDVDDYEMRVREVFGYIIPGDIVVVSGNPFLIKNFEGKGYSIFRPENNYRVSATELRGKIYRNEDWQRYVPKTTVEFLLKDDNLLRVKKVCDEKPIPPYVNWELTNRCNMGCPYCFLGEHPDGVLQDLSTDVAKSLIDKLTDGGAEMLNYAGGEPLLREDIVELIEYGKGLGLKTILSTNGILLSKKLIRRLEGCLDWISLPVDGYDSGTSDGVRGRVGHFNQVLGHLRELEKTNISLKVNTMLCKKNIDYAEKIASLLDGFDIKKWKLFQFSPRGKANKVRGEYEISDEQFLSSKGKLGSHAFEIVYSSNELRDNAYFLIGTDGKVNVPVGDTYVYFGDLLSDELSRFRESELLKISKNTKNASVSYDLGVKNVRN